MQNKKFEVDEMRRLDQMKFSPAAISLQDLPKVSYNLESQKLNLKTLVSLWEPPEQQWL